MKLELVKELATIHLSACVPLRIREYVEQGGPDEQDFGRARNDYAWRIGAHGDDFLFGGKHAGSTMNKLVDGLAILAFCPGGITFFDLHFEEIVPCQQPLL